MGAAGSRDDDFTAFVLARSARLMHFARMLCGDAGLAEDLVQTALEKAYLRWDRIELADPFAYVRQGRGQPARSAPRPGTGRSSGSPGSPAGSSLPRR